jgi:hypothetical protein
MSRPCWNCGTPFRAEDLDTQETRTLQEACRAKDLRGVRFLYYSCLVCGRVSILLDVRPLPGETAADFAARRQALNLVAGEVGDEELAVVVVTG